MVDEGVYGDDLDDISELDQAENQSILRKLAQPHKLKINPNLEILHEFKYNFANFENFENNFANFEHLNQK